MKLLMLTPYLPYPLLTGGQTRSFNLIKRLSALGHEITLFSLVKSNDERKYVGQLQKFCREVHVFSRSEKPWIPKNILKTGFSFYPFLVIRNWAKGEKAAIEQKIRHEKFDLIHAETFYVMPHIPKTEIPILLVEQTIEHLVYRHFADEFKFPLLKLLLYIDVLKMKYWELLYWKKAKAVVAMSEEDKKMMMNEVLGLDVDIVPNGVDSKFFGESVIEKAKEPIILYLGNFTWLQNREAVQILLTKVWPKIKQGLPKAKLWIVGKEAGDFFADLASEDILVSEIADVREAYQKASILVAPIYGGGGTRYKNFEAFASGLPVVTTSIGIRGTDAQDGKEVIIRDDPDEIAKAAIKLLNDKALSKRIAENAKKMVRAKYDWDPIAKKLSNIYENLGKKN
ncbi:MAG: glycosyltransferase family 4 protein [Candidatus Daviesbacteria bacterium]|nr:glycosyltransferase family 4 protein [Candidatus Daviesbacteria bacterium]